MGRHDDSEVTYTNPVYDGYFADPFVLPVDGAFYAYGTGRRFDDGRVFEVLRSTDLVRWESLGGALVERPAPQEEAYWAPEVALADGTFHLYYSVGVEDRGHTLRVALSERPEGPFEDAGVDLTPDERFAIDAHPFRDDDGRWYLYYAHDVLEGERVGTTIAVDRMHDPTTLEGAPRTLLRASADWQLFRRAREMYGEVRDWYTLEGPFLRKRDGRYWLLYSGGAWESESYGVSFAVADDPLGPYEEPVEGPCVLCAAPGEVLGPGHNSIVRCTGSEDLIVYHAWDPERTARRMCVDRLEWTPDGPVAAGPTRRPQPVPSCR
jgi:arabinan endo-1,5-alpha-L-arabinosidase